MLEGARSKDVLCLFADRAWTARRRARLPGLPDHLLGRLDGLEGASFFSDRLADKSRIPPFDQDS